MTSVATASSTLRWRTSRSCSSRWRSRTDWLTTSRTCSSVEDTVDDPDTAIFYSITSAQPGLAGVHLGNELIKQVVDELRRTDDDLKTFATLSPLPGFRSWLRSEVNAGELTPIELESFGDDLDAVVGGDESWAHDPAARGSAASPAFSRLPRATS